MKLTKKSDDIILFLKEDKKIKNIDKELLKTIGYMNLITPYKHFFHKGKDINGNHKYEIETELKIYYNYYINDKKQTQIIRELIFDFEKNLKSEINIFLSDKYENIPVEKVNEIIKEEIIKYIENIKFSDITDEDKKARLLYKIEKLEQLIEKIGKEKTFYLSVNKLELSNIKGILDVYSINRYISKFFYSNFNNVRVLRNSLSHGDTIQMHLNRLKEKEYNKTIEIIKYLSKNNKFNEVEIDYRTLDKSYKIYNNK